MSIKDIRFELTRLADRGVIAENRVIPLTMQTVLEAMQQGFHKAYYGGLLDKELDNVRGLDHDVKERALINMEAMIGDFERTRRAHKEVHTTSDFPLAVAYARQAATRPGYTYEESDLPSFATRRTAQDFKVLKGHRPGAIGHKFLPVRPESTNVQFTKFYVSEDGYSVANYELGIPFTWESWINDELGDLAAAAADMGNVARRTRAMVIVDAIFRGAFRIPLVDGEQGPTGPNLDAVATYMANQVTVDNRRVGRRVTELFVPIQWERLANRSMENETVIALGTGNGTPALVSNRNPVFNLAGVHVEDIIADILDEYPDRYAAKAISASDYIVMDGARKPVELATLRGYEGGPKTFTLLPDVVETDLEGSWNTHTIAMKVTDNVGAGLSDPYAVAIAQGN
ncbi:hypothetical protein [Deinococcus altitudinis]|uniref:phage major capsid protein n=1 Tax=Deinococcus altitudinis TaxID=468914 RepID=UPI003891CE0F